MKLMFIGLVWQFVLSMLMLYREEGNIRISDHLSPFLAEPSGVGANRRYKETLWWWIVPLIVLVAFVEIGFKSTFVNLWATIFPLFAEPKGYEIFSMFTPELRAQMVGEWSLFGLIFVNALFKSVLGEELLFRGVLLPKMEGGFGKWDWVANGVMFSFYHLHQPWGILATLPADLLFAYSGKRFRCNWFPIILHYGQSIFLVVVILGLVLGLA